jgi:hypothetical protein
LPACVVSFTPFETVPMKPERADARPGLIGKATN